MAKKLSDFIKNLIIKAGSNPDDENLKAGLAAIGPDLEIADEVATSIDNGLLSLATAKNSHPDIKNHYFAQAYNGLDNELQKLIDAEKLPEDIVADIKKETSSTKRAVLLATKLKELEGKKSSTKQGDTQKLNDQIVDLNNQLRAEKDRIAEIERKHTGEKKEIRQRHALNQLLGGYKTIHDSLDPSTKAIILNAIIQKNLDSKNALWDIDDSDNLKLVGKDNSNIFGDDNRQLTPKTFLDQVLANEKMLVVNDSGNNNQNNNNNSNRPNNGQHFNNNGQHNGNNNSNSNQRPKNAYLRDLIKQSTNDINQSTNNGGVM